MRLESISRNDNGDFYVVYSLPSPQKITKACRESKKRELLIIGFNKSKMKEMFPTLLEGCDEE